MPFGANLQRHIAWCAIAGTTLRNMLPPGWRPIVCGYLADIDLGEMHRKGFLIALDDWTAELSAAVGGVWGPSRKALNLFLRDLDYNVWTREEFNFPAVEGSLEVPLDGIVMKKIRLESERALLDVWVKDLTPEISAAYQEAAQVLAEQRETMRVHLDVDWWAQPAEG